MTSITPSPLRANPGTSVGRIHVESERSLESVLAFPTSLFRVEGFVDSGPAETRVLSADASTGESTHRVTPPKGFKAAIGHFDADVEIFVLTGELRQGHWSMQDDPFNRRYAPMRQDGYYWRPAHIPHGPFWSETGGLLLIPYDRPPRLQLGSAQPRYHAVVMTV